MTLLNSASPLALIPHPELPAEKFEDLIAPVPASVTPPEVIVSPPLIALSVTSAPAEMPPSLVAATESMFARLRSVMSAEISDRLATRTCPPMTWNGGTAAVPFQTVNLLASTVNADVWFVPSSCTRPTTAPFTSIATPHRAWIAPSAATRADVSVETAEEIAPLRADTSDAMAAETSASVAYVPSIVATRASRPVFAVFTELSSDVMRVPCAVIESPCEVTVVETASSAVFSPVIPVSAFVMRVTTESIRPANTESALSRAVCSVPTAAIAPEIAPSRTSTHPVPS